MSSSGRRVVIPVLACLALGAVRSSGAPAGNPALASAGAASPGAPAEALDQEAGDPTHFIVQFRGEPAVLVARRDGLPAAQRARDETAEQAAALRDALARLAAATPLHVPGATRPAIRAEFSTVFRGAAITIDPRLLGRVRSLSFVERVGRDRPVRALLDASAPLIGADKVWSGTGVPASTGAGIVVSIVDTGTDYTHPDVCPNPPNCFRASGAKVVDGIDTINADTDPMDDHGHGTHVAATVAGRNAAFSLVGIAPDATLYAAKVLAASGYGEDSNIIGGIEWSIDPDGDLATPDGANIISMSLGGSGSPDDPMSQSIDNATAAGTLCVIAAGNSGGGGRYQTILSPGVAATALTVGASDKADRMADFSSKGPGQFLELKPCLTAPGVDICAAELADWLSGLRCKDDKHIAISGTSMATPHVAGAAALVMAEHPTWTIDEVKAALRETAKDLGYDVMQQGSGRIDVLEAVKAEGLILPAEVNFGRDDVRCPPAPFRKDVALSLENKTGAPQSWTFALAAPPPPGITITFAPPSTLVAPRLAVPITVSITVDNASVPAVNGPPFGYFGAILATTATESLRLPWYVATAAMQPISMDFWAERVDIHDRAGRTYTYHDPGQYIEPEIPPGTYDIVVYGYGEEPIVVKEGVAVSACSNPVLSVLQADASHVVTWTLVDSAGLPFTDGTGAGNLRVSHVGGYAASFTGGFAMTRHVSDASAAYTFDWSWVGRPASTDQLHQASGSWTSVSGDVVQSNAAADYRHAQLQWLHPSSVGAAWSAAAMAAQTSAGYGEDLPWALNAAASKGPPFLEDVWQEDLPRAGFPAEGALRPVSMDWQYYWWAGNRFYRGPVLSTLDGVMRLSYAGGAEDQLLSWPSASGRLLQLGLAPPAFLGQLEVTPTQVNISNSRGAELYLFHSQLGDVRPDVRPAWELWRSGDAMPLNTGTITRTGQAWGATEQVDLPAPGAYTLKVSYPFYTVRDAPGLAVAEMSFDSTLADAEPPAITLLLVADDGWLTDTIGCNPGATLGASFSEAGGGLSVVAEARSPAGTGSWTALPFRGVSKLVFQWDLLLPPVSGLVDLRLTANDRAGNRLVYTVTPAYRTQVTTPVGSTLRVTRGPSDVTLTWADSPGASSYDVRRAQRYRFADGSVIAQPATSSFADLGAATDRLLHYYLVETDGCGN